MIRWVLEKLGLVEARKVREARRKHTDRVKHANSQRREAYNRYNEQCSTICLPGRAPGR